MFLARRMSAATAGQRLSIFARQSPIREAELRFWGLDANPSAPGSAPLDPLIYDCRVTAALWGYDYMWEVYTPPHERVCGYYALTIRLAGLT